ncbi:hypothetical protein [Nostoc sp.]|uniref:hypothetical protein n=1 Tax=Nostoc sp. TaxID=1180 RepID=UPI002FF8E598
MELVHQIITVILLIISLLERELDGWDNNISAGIKEIKSKPFIYRFQEDQYNIYLPGEIYQ